MNSSDSTVNPQSRMQPIPSTIPQNSSVSDANQPNISTELPPLPQNGMYVQSKITEPVTPNTFNSTLTPNNDFAGNTPKVITNDYQTNTGTQIQPIPSVIPAAVAPIPVQVLQTEQIAPTPQVVPQITETKAPVQEPIPTVNVSAPLAQSTLASTQPATISREIDPAEISQTRGISEAELALQQRPKPDDIVVYTSNTKSNTANQLRSIAEGTDPNSIPAPSQNALPALSQPEPTQAPIPVPSPVSSNQPEVKEQNDASGLASTIIGFLLYIILFIGIGALAAYTYNACMSKTNAPSFCEPVLNVVGPLFGLDKK